MVDDLLDRAQAVFDGSACVIIVTMDAFWQDSREKSAGKFIQAISYIKMSSENLSRMCYADNGTIVFFFSATSCSPSGNFRSGWVRNPL